MAMRKVTLAMTEEMYDGLEKERKMRRLETIPETARAILSEFFRDR